jgi:hypothetical protein
MGYATGRFKAAPGRRGVFDVDERRALEALYLAWGDAYDIGISDGTWHARRVGDDSDLSGRTPDELVAAIRADWAREGTLEVPG